MPRFSVIIPLYNKENEIHATLSSVFKQTFTDYELIIVDDGSTDDSVSIINSFNNENLHLFSKENEGVSIARNFGVEKANSKYIVFLDADDYWYPNHLENLNLLITNFPNHSWFASSYEKKHSAALISAMYTPVLKKGKDWNGEVTDFFINSLVDCLAWTSSICMKKDFYNSLNGFDVRISHGEDTDLWIRAALKEKLVFSNKITAQHNLISSNRSSKVKMDKRKNFLFDKFLKEEKVNPSLKKYLDLNRYSIAIKYKLSNDHDGFKRVSKNIDEVNLNKKQRFLLKQPKVFLKLLLKIKSVIEYFGFRLSSF